MNPRRDEAPQPDVEFSGLYRTYAHELRRFAVFLSGNPALADDLVSEAFVRAWSVPGRIEFSTVRGYLFAIVRNLFLQQIRHERRRRPLDEGMIDERPGPEARASEQDDLRVVLEALAALPEVAVPPPTVEKRALDRTRRHWRLRSIVLGVAIYVSTLPLTVTFNRSGFRGLLIQDWPERIVLMVLAAALWATYVVLLRRWHATGR